MCCDDDALPDGVAAMLAGYRDMLAARGYDWGDELPALAVLDAVITLLDQSKLDDAVRGLADEPPAGVESDDSQARIILAATPDPLPAGLVIVQGTDIRIADTTPYVIGNAPITYRVVTIGDSASATRLDLEEVSANQPDLMLRGGQVRAVQPAASGRLRLVADDESRWSVVDDRGGAWFPSGALRKFDYHGRPFFHGNDMTVDVPVGRTTVTVARGCEFRAQEVQVTVSPGSELTFELDLERLFDAAGRGWYGGDLHVHMNYSGELVCCPADAARMQRGEGLHLMNLVAANSTRSLIYDKEALEEYAGQNLPSSTAQAVARFGVEYRNDLLGHFHALNPSAPPTRYQTGHERSDEPQDWPPNSVAASELQALGATVGYTHPLKAPLGPDDSLEGVFDDIRSMDARELVADAALGLVDSLDLTGNHYQNLLSTERLYHRLLGCGLRLAATAGTDAMLSRSRHMSLSNPPGWCRAYAFVGDGPLSVEAWQDAVRAGRTFSTNGPWLELDVAGHALGARLHADRGDSLTVTARVIGLGVDRLEIVGPDGLIDAVELAEDAESAEVRADVAVSESSWIAAVARGGEHPSVLGPQVYAHTSPVWVDVDGPVGRPDDARWCLDWLSRLEDLARSAGRFTAPGQLEDLVAVLDEARLFYRRVAS
jgi:hypothetical protein